MRERGWKKYREWDSKSIEIKGERSYCGKGKIESKTREKKKEDKR